MFDHSGTLPLKKSWEYTTNFSRMDNWPILLFFPLGNYSCIMSSSIYVLLIHFDLLGSNIFTYLWEVSLR